MQAERKAPRPYGAGRSSLSKSLFDKLEKIMKL